MSDEKPVTDPETIAAYVRIARIVYGIDDDRPDPREIDNPSIVVETLEGAKGQGVASGRCPISRR